MKNIKLLLVGTAVALGSVAHASDGVEGLFDTKCAVCHSKTRPADMDKALAPAIMGVMKHVKVAYPNREKAVEFMVDYVLEPSKAKSICKPKKIEHFGLMPSQKANVTKEELTQISQWLYDNYPPADFKGMGHGKGHGMGHGKGDRKREGKGHGRGMKQGQNKPHHDR